jgi:dienelactone hydrolase
MAESLFTHLPFDEELLSDAQREARVLDSSGNQKSLQDFLQRLGKLPQRSRSQDIHLATWDCGEYLQELLAIRMNENQAAPAYLLMPKQSPKPLPVLLCIHGHGGNYYWGKSKVTSRSKGVPTYGYALPLVKLGYAVLALDLPAFEERSFAAQVQPGPWPTATERLIFGNLLLKGSTLMGWDLWELSNAIDYLETRSEIDAQRLGVIGHSMGGTLAPLLMLFDHRPKVCVSSCGISTWRHMLERHVVHNFACYIPGLMEAGDLDELFMQIAPRPFLIISGEEDPNFPPEGVRAIVSALGCEYQKHKAPQALEAHILPGGHFFDEQRQSLATQFLARWLPATLSERARPE